MVEHCKEKVDGCRQHPYKREQCADRNYPRLRVLGTTLQPQGKEPGQRDTTKNHGRMGGIRQTPGYLQKQPCDLPEETSVQLLCGATYDIWCRDLDTDQTSTEQTCGRTDQHGQKYAQHHIQHCEKNEMVLGRAYQPPQRRPMDLAYHQLETIMTRKDDKGDQPSDGETTWTNTGATRYGGGQHKTG